MGLWAKAMANVPAPLMEEEEGRGQERGLKISGLPSVEKRVKYSYFKFTFQITSVLALSSITVVDCALVNNTGNTSVIMLDLFSSVPLTPTDVESLLTSESLQNEINLTISDVFFAGKYMKMVCILTLIC